MAIKKQQLGNSYLAEKIETKIRQLSIQLAHYNAKAADVVKKLQHDLCTCDSPYSLAATAWDLLKGFESNAAKTE